MSGIYEFGMKMKMGLKEDSVILINLRCGWQQVTVTLLHGN